MAAENNTIKALRRPSKAQINTFMGRLFDPLPDAEIADPEMARLLKRARKANWASAMKSLAILKCRSTEMDLRTRGERHDAPLMKERWATHAAHLRAVHQIIINDPAPTMAEVAWKRRRSGLGSDFIGEAAYAAQDAAIADDVARLEREGGEK